METRSDDCMLHCKVALERLDLLALVVTLVKLGRLDDKASVVLRATSALLGRKVS